MSVSLLLFAIETFIVSLNHQAVFVLRVVDLHSVLGVVFLVGETCQKPMSPIRHPDAALLPRPRVGWPSNVPFDGASPYPSQIQFVQEDPVFPKFRHVTAESMSRNGRPAGWVEKNVRQWKKAMALVAISGGVWRTSDIKTVGLPHALHPLGRQGR